MGKRRRARELALQFLYEYDALRESAGDSLNPEKQLSFFWERSGVDVDSDTLEFCTTLIKGSCANKEYIDNIIAKYSKHWTVSRMSTIDRNVLRLAIYELVYLSNIPAPVTINEAIELGKKFGTEESGSFINGILDKIKLSQEKGEFGNDERSNC